MNGILRVSYIHTGLISLMYAPRSFQKSMRATRIFFIQRFVGAAAFSGVSSEQFARRTETRYICCV